MWKSCFSCKVVKSHKHPCKADVTTCSFGLKTSGLKFRNYCDIHMWVKLRSLLLFQKNLFNVKSFIQIWSVFFFIQWSVLPIKVLLNCCKSCCEVCLHVCKKQLHQISRSTSYFLFFHIFTVLIEETVNNQMFCMPCFYT